MTKSLLSLLLLPVLLLIGLGLFSTQKPSQAQPPEDLASRVFDLLDKRCGQCHGETGSNKDLMLISRTGYNTLVARRSVAVKIRLVDTEKPEASLLYLRITGRHSDGVMPPAYAANPRPLTLAEQNVILQWIQAGAPDWKNAPRLRPVRRFIDNADILRSIEQDLAKLDADRRKDTRYFTLTHLYNAGISDIEIAAYRDGLKRLLNSLSWEGKIILPESIDPEQTIFRINLKKYGWKAATWQNLLHAYPYHLRLGDAGFSVVCKTTDCELPFLRADWFVTHAALPPLYHDILELPGGKDADVKLEKLLLDRRGNRDANQDIREAPGDRVWRSGFRKSGVSANNRVVERHASLYGYYWKSYDFSDEAGYQNIKAHPLDFQRAGGEIIFGLPNGLQGYMLVGKDGTRLDIAPSNIVSNDRATTKDRQIYNGLSCMGCHTQGMIDGFTLDEVRNTIARFPDGETRRQGMKLYTEREEMQRFLEEDRRRFREALAKMNSVAGTNEPMVALAEKFQGEVDTELAAAELGLSEAKFLEIVTALNDPILNDFKEGKVARTAWEEHLHLAVGRMPGVRYMTAAQAPLSPNASLVPIPDSPHFAMGLQNPKDHAALALIPAGEFMMGSNEGEDDERPPHRVRLSAYAIYRYPVTVAQYETFVADMQKRGEKIAGQEAVMPPSPSFNSDWSKKDHPMVNETWDEAEAYCEWAGGHLPTEAQYERAAGGPQTFKFPWGNTFDPNKVWASKNQVGDAGGTAPAGMFVPNGFGLYNMVGNVLEWCSDGYDRGFYSNPLAKQPDPKGPSSPIGDRALRGGSWVDHGADFFRCANRGWDTPTDRRNNNGFRCVVRVP